MHSLNILFVKNCHNELKFKTISFVLFYIELTLFMLAREMQLADVLYEDLFNNLPKEKQSELIGRKDYFAKKAGITL